MTRRIIMRAAESGQALLEALIASAIIAAMLAVTCQSLITATRAEYALRSKRVAVALAQSLLARVGGDIPLAPGAIDGNSDGLDWRVEISVYDEGAGRSIDGPPIFDVHVRVGHTGSAVQSAALRTLRVAA